MEGTQLFIGGVVNKAQVDKIFKLIKKEFGITLTKFDMRRRDTTCRLWDIPFRDSGSLNLDLLVDLLHTEGISFLVRDDENRTGTYWIKGMPEIKDVMYSVPHRVLREWKEAADIYKTPKKWPLLINESDAVRHIVKEFLRGVTLEQFLVTEITDILPPLLTQLPEFKLIA